MKLVLLSTSKPTTSIRDTRFLSKVFFVDEIRKEEKIRSGREGSEKLALKVASVSLPPVRLGKESLTDAWRPLQVH